MALYVLFEHAAGYSLFRVKQFEEIGMLLPEVEKSVLNFSHFCSVVQLMAFYPFKGSENALENIINISEGLLHQDLQLFLETNLPKSSKKVTVTLGLGDPKIGAAIQEALSIHCQHTGAIPEILRGIRLHFHNLVKGLTEQSASKVQLGLGHSYSRSKVKFNINRNDNMIIQSISLLDQLDKDVNTFAMRVREWYSYHFPELIKIVPENYNYAKVVKYVKNRKELSDSNMEELEELVMDGTKAKAIIDAAKSSMGMDISPIDLINIEMFATRVINLAEYRKALMEYLKSKMHNVAPNLATLIGDTVGARLISHAGSLTNLAKYPASTVQILGAEKALFRALKTRGNTPKYGLIFHSTFIGRAASKNKGRISRFLANKCSIASRIDCFSDIPNDVFGNRLKEQVEERLKFFETGEIPRKNIDVMKIAVEEAAVAAAKLRKKRKKEKKKKQKEQMSILNSSVDETIHNIEENGEESSVKKKKKKEKSFIINSTMNETVSNINTSQDIEEVEQPIKKKKKKKKEQSLNVSSGMDETIPEDDVEEELSAKKKNKKKRQSSALSPGLDSTLSVEEPLTKKKKKKRKSDNALMD